MNELDGKVALVTGAGRGIGRAIAERLASDGARVVINDLDADPAEETRADIEAAGGEATVCLGSVTADAFPDRFVDTAVRHFGGIDIVVNNAGYTWDNVIQKMSDEQWDAILDLHAKAPFRILRAVQPIFRDRAKEERSRGVEVFRKVVNISSMAGTRGNAGQANYSSAKAAVIGLTRALAKEWGRYKVNVNAVAFGMIETRLSVAGSDGQTIDVEGRRIEVGVSAELAAAAAAAIPLGRPGTPEEAAGAVHMLCSPGSDYVTGQVLECGGGVAL